PVIDDIDIVSSTCGSSNGSIQVFASGGVGTLSFSINGGTTFQGSNFFPNLPSGTYSIVVRDEANCEVFDVAVIQDLGGPMIGPVTTTQSTCGFADGSIKITATGTAPLTYSINGVNFVASNTFNGLPAGTYTVYVRDGNGSVASQQVNVTSISGPQITNVI